MFLRLSKSLLEAGLESSWSCLRDFLKSLKGLLNTDLKSSKSLLIADLESSWSRLRVFLESLKGLLKVFLQS